jgi:hypothetical protein
MYGEQERECEQKCKHFYELRKWSNNLLEVNYIQFIAPWMMKIRA